VLVGSVKRLSSTDVSYVVRAIGAATDDDHPVQIASSSPHLWPPKNIPNGLYRDVIRSRSYSQLLYYICSIFYSTALILQVILGAILTALGATSHTHGTAITILAAANTVNGGIIALLTNTGLPDRFLNDWNEFDDVETYLKEIIETGLVESDSSADDVVVGCYQRFQDAKTTIRKNKPASYVPTSAKRASGSASTASLLGAS